VSDVPEDVREALIEVQQYLSDVVPPLIVADSVARLLELPPDPLAAEINGWTQEQLARDRGGAAVSDYFFHAVSKLHMVGEFRLVPRDTLAGYLGELGEMLLGLCPAEERAGLAEALLRIANAPTGGVSPLVPRLSLPGGAAAAQGARPDEDVEFARSMRRLTFLLRRLEELPAVPEERAETGAGVRTEIESRILAGAIGSARSAEELRLYQDHLTRLGVDATPARAFRVLGGSLPAWADPRTDTDATTGPAPRHSPREAMRRLVVLEKESSAGATRFQELVSAAVEQFNAGSLARAVTMLDTATRLVEDGEVSNAAAESARARCHELLDRSQLGAIAGTPDSHVLLRRLLSFFPAYSSGNLLDTLQAEEKRERRRLLLQLLEVIGPPARSIALERLKSSLDSFGFGDFYFKRNLVFLLRRIPRDGTSSVEEEVGLATRLTEKGHAPMVVKEAIALLAQTRLERAERVLSSRLKEFEAMLVGKEESVYGRDELLGMLDRVVSALARFGTASARRVVVRHGLRRQAELGDTLARLAELGSQDLSADGELVRRLLEELAARTPRKVLGVTVRGDSRALLQLVTALSGTHDERVHEVLKGLTQRFPTEEFTEVAEKALAAAGTTPAPEPLAVPMLAGDLELMDLPTLLQNLAATQASGLLRLLSRDEGEVAAIELEEGKLLQCRCTDLSDSPAFFQIFERPRASTFTFSASAEPPPAAAEKKALEVVPLLFEAMRRCDEFAGASVLVPDDARFRSTVAQPLSHPEESDPGLGRVVWARVTSGSTALACENGLGVDAFTVRRLLAHWVEEGALEPVAGSGQRRA
jgi:hypothetical protein